MCADCLSQLTYERRLLKTEFDFGVCVVATRIITGNHKFICSRTKHSGVSFVHSITFENEKDEVSGQARRKRERERETGRQREEGKEMEFGLTGLGWLIRVNKAVAPGVTMGGFK